MLVFENMQKESLSGEVEYVSTDKDDQIVIGSIYSFSESGLYISWGMDKCGYGQFSMGLGKNGWTIDNETMGLKTCSRFLKTFEAGIIAENNIYATYILNKLKFKIYPGCESLEQGLALIWREGNTDLERVNPDKFTRPLVLDDLSIYDISYEDTAQNTPLPNKKILMPSYDSIYISSKFDYKWKQFGHLILQADIFKDGKIVYSISKDLKEDTFENILTIIEKIDEQELRAWLDNESIKNALHVKDVWNTFKIRCNLKSNTKETIKQILQNDSNQLGINKYAIVRG